MQIFTQEWWANCKQWTKNGKKESWQN